MNSRVAIVTGAAKPDSIGFAVAQGLLEEDCEVVVADLYEDGFSRFKGLCIRTDVADPASVQRMIDAVMARFHRIDILVNCVGGSWGITEGDLTAAPHQEAGRGDRQCRFGRGAQGNPARRRGLERALRRGEGGRHGPPFAPATRAT